MKVFRGEYELNVDEKSRISVPMEFRRLINKGADTETGALIAMIGENGRAWLYPEEDYERMAARQEDELTPIDAINEYEQLFFGPTHKLEWDKQGRTVLPQRLVIRAGLGKHLMLVGINRHLELWNAPEWNEWLEGLLARRKEILARARETRRVSEMGQ